MAPEVQANGHAPFASPGGERISETLAMGHGSKPMESDSASAFGAVESSKVRLVDTATQ